MIAPERIRCHLVELLQSCSLSAASQLFDAPGYQYNDELPSACVFASSLCDREQSYPQSTIC
jgi:hypothetical protein